MFSFKEKQKIAAGVEKLLLSIGNPEMPLSKPYFELHVAGKEAWSWADIRPNTTIRDISPNAKIGSWWDGKSRRD